MISEVNCRLEAIRRQAQRDYWLGVAWLVISAAMQMPFLYAAWRLFCAP